MPLGDIFLSFVERIAQWRTRTTIEQFIALLSPEKSDVILDVGAGTGWIADHVASKCDEVYAAEPNEKRVDYIRRNHPQVKVFIGSAESIPFPEEYFNKLYAIMSFHHFSNREAAIQEFNRTLKRGGTLLIREYDSTSKGSRSVRYFENKILKSKIHFLDPRELTESLEENGFNIKRIMIDERHGAFVLCAQKDAA